MKATTASVWYCLACDEDVPPEDVTSDGEHDAHGCGEPVQSMEQHAAQLKRELAEQEIRLTKAKDELSGWEAEAYFAAETVGNIKRELSRVGRILNEPADA